MIHVASYLCDLGQSQLARQPQSEQHVVRQFWVSTLKLGILSPISNVQRFIFYEVGHIGPTHAQQDEPTGITS